MSEPTSNLDSILRKVQALLAKAESSEFSEEAEALRQKADTLMFKYRIDETMAASAAVGQVRTDQPKPVWRTIFVSRLSSEFASTYRYMAAVALGHVDARSASSYVSNPDDNDQTWLTMKAVGYESDLRYAELIYTSMHLAFASKMEPAVNPEKSDAENAYNMRSAGMEGRRIAALLWGDDSKPNRVKARRLFAQHAASIGEDPSVLLGRGNSVSAYRESYASGFETEMSARLYRMRISHGDSGEMVLASRKDAVTEAFYAEYPNRRPGPTAQPGRSIGGRDTCDKCKKAKSGYCRDHQHLKPSQARYVERNYSAAGAARGRVAARSVDLGASKGGNRVQGGGATAIG